MLDYLIIGGGISGLCAGYFAKKQHQHYLILEKSSHLGGVLSSENREDYLIEKSVNTLLYSPILCTLVRDLGIENQVIFPRNDSKSRLIYYQNQLHQVPTSPIDILRSPLFNHQHKFKLLHALFFQKPIQGEISIYDFFSHYLGQELTELFVDAMVSGIWAGNINQLSMNACFSQLHKNTLKYRRLFSAIKHSTRHKAPLISFKNGNSTLVNALVTFCQPHCYTQQNIKSLSWHEEKHYFQIHSQTSTYEAKKIIICTPIDQVPTLLKSYLSDNAYKKLITLCQSVIYTPLYLVYSAYQREGIEASTLDKLNSLGFLIPRNQKKKILGTIFNSSLFAQRCHDNHILLTTFIGGEHFRGVTQLSPSSLYELVNKELAEILHLPQPPIWQHHMAWQHAIPQYLMGHQSTITKIKQLINHPNILFNANWHDGTAIPKIIEKSARIFLSEKSLIG